MRVKVSRSGAACCFCAILLAIIGLLVLGCNSGGTATARTPGTTGPNAPTSTVPNGGVSTSTTQQTPIPTQTGLVTATQPATQFSVDNIQADYVYTSQLITVLYPLYGSKLDDFVIVTLTNKDSVPAKILVESEIVGYTSTASDTVTLDPGETSEVRQNPLLIPKVIDDLNVEKPAPVHVRVAALQEGVEKPILDETGQTTVYSRRDFPWSISGFTESEVNQFLAAMVTPNDPSVEGLLRKAANHTDSGIIWGGYGGHVNDDNGGVWDRLQAIWQAENEYNLTYVSTDISCPCRGGDSPRETRTIWPLD